MQAGRQPWPTTQFKYTSTVYVIMIDLEIRLRYVSSDSPCVPRQLSGRLDRVTSSTARALPPPSI